MAKLINVSLGLLSTMALLSNSLSSNTVSASFSTVNQGVVRIDLEKKYINTINNIMLSDDIDVDNMVEIDAKVNAGENIELLLDANQNNYSVMREHQRRHVHRQHNVMNLAQND